MKSVERTSLKVSGMTCNHCVNSVTNALKELDGVLNAKVSLSDEKADITYDAAKVHVDDLKKAVEDAGYKAS